MRQNVSDTNLTFIDTQVDSGDLDRALQRTRNLLGEFIREEAHRSILIHNCAEGLTVWLSAPHGADIKNSLSFTKKELKCDPKSYVLLTHSLSSPTPPLSLFLSMCVCQYPTLLLLSYQNIHFYLY
jgi:hypothetical protein